MRYFRQGWIGVIGDAVAFGPLLWRYIIRPLLGALSLGGDVDFVLEHVRHLGWVAGMIEFLAHPATQLIVLALGLALIYFDPKRQLKSADQLQLQWRKSNMWPIVLVWIGAALVLSGLTWAYLNYQSFQKETSSALRRYVLPRHLSDEQKAAIASYLLKFPPLKNVKIQVQRFVVSETIREPGKDVMQRYMTELPMDEPIGFANDIRDALIAGGWEPSFPTFADIPNLGVGVQYQPPPQPIDPKRTKPDTILLSALKAARVFVGSTGGAGSTPDREESVTITVGKRRMDDSEIKRSTYMRERAQQTLKEIEAEEEK